MTATTKEEMLGLQSGAQRVLPRLRAIESLDDRTELTRVGPAWRHVLETVDTEENPTDSTKEEQDATKALRDFRAAHDRRRRLAFPLMFVMGGCIGVLASIAPHSRLFRRYVHVSPPAVAAAAVVAPAAAPASPPSEAQSGSAMSPLDIDAILPRASAPPQITTTIVTAASTKHTSHATPQRASSAPASPSPSPVAKAPSSHAKARAASTDDDETVKNARAADDLAAAQLSDSL